MPVVAIAAGVEHMLALTDMGTVLTWGNAPAPPENLANVKAIAAGAYVSLALLADGTVVGWGATEVPKRLSDVVTITAGGLHCFAIQRDGTIVGWRKSPYRTHEPAEPVNWSPGSIPAAVSHYSGFGLGLDARGRVVHERLEGAMSGDVPALPGSWSLGVTAVSAGYAHALAVSADGEVLSWATESQLRTSQLHTPSGLRNAVKVAAGGAFSLALLANGTVVGWGQNEYGQREVPSQLRNITSIAAGTHFGAALTAGGKVVAWGRNNHGQIDVPESISEASIVLHASRPASPLVLIGTGAPRLLIVDGYPDEESETKFFDLSSEETMLAEAQQMLGLSAHSIEPHDYRRAAACLLNNIAARDLVLRRPSQAFDRLDESDRLLRGILNDHGESVKYMLVMSVIPVALATVAFNYSLAQTQVGDFSGASRSIETAEQLLEWGQMRGLSLTSDKGPRVIRTAMQRLTASQQFGRFGGF